MSSVLTFQHDATMWAQHRLLPRAGGYGSHVTQLSTDNIAGG